MIVRNAEVDGWELFGAWGRDMGSVGGVFGILEGRGVAQFFLFVSCLPDSNKLPEEIKSVWKHFLFSLCS